MASPGETKNTARARWLLAIVAGTGVLVLALTAAMAPSTAMAAAALLLAGMVALGAVASPGAVRGIALPRLLVLPAAAAIVGLVLATALAPGTTLVGTAILAVAVAAWQLRPRLSVHGRRTAARLVLAFPVCLAGAAVLAFVSATWPAAFAVAAVVAIVLALAWRAPPWAFAAGLLLIAFEGTIKVLLGLDATSLPGSSRAIGAAAIDLALFGAIAGVLLADRLATPRRIWAAASRGERAALTLLGAWLALSVLQILQGGDPQRGLEGFRLFQAYVVAGVAAAILVARARRLEALVTVGLAIALVVSAYAAFRVMVGPSDAERFFATVNRSTIQYGENLRTFGSFSSSIGMVSFLTPVVVASVVAGYLQPRLRLLAWGVAGLALVGVLGSYSRGALFGILVGLLFALALLVASGELSPRRKLAAGSIVAATILVTIGGVYVASRGSETLSERASGQDQSVQMRFDTWRELLGTVDEHPLGRGIGTVGAASTDGSGEVTTADNSFLKLLVEQGIPGAALFLAALFGGIVLLARRLVRVGGDRGAAGVASLGAFVGFLALSTTGEYVEQPGKAAAWALLGIAVGAALVPAPERGARA